MPDATQVSTLPLQIAFFASVVALILIPQAIMAMASYLRDPAARRRTRLRLRPLPPLPETIPGAAYLDVSAQTASALRRLRGRTALRTLAVLIAIAATLKLGLVTQLVVLSLLALAGAIGEAVRHRIRRTSGAHALWGWRSMLLALLGATTTLGLASIGVMLLVVFLAARFFGLLPKETEQRFEGFLFGTGMVLIGV